MGAVDESRMVRPILTTPITVGEDSLERCDLRGAETRTRALLKQGGRRG